MEPRQWQTFSAHSSGGWQSKAEAAAGSVSPEASLLGWQTAAFPVPSPGRGSVFALPWISQWASVITGPLPGEGEAEEESQGEM